jgi:hypothetical protein
MPAVRGHFWLRHSTGLNGQLSSRAVGRTVSEIALPRMNASTRQATSCATTSCTLSPFLYVPSIDDSSVESLDTEKFIVEVLIL